MFNKAEYIYAVYKEKSFSKAAKKLYVSQPYLSSVVKKIEEQIGMPIFERRYSELRPTLIGYEYIDAIEQIINIKKNFLQKLGSASEMEYGSLRVGGSNYVCSYILPEIINSFRRLYPKIEIIVVENSSAELEKKLANEEIDLLIDSFDDENNLYSGTKLVNESILLAVPKSRQSNKKLKKYQLSPAQIFEGTADISAVPEVDIDNFKNENFIILKKGNSMSRHSQEVFRLASFTPEISFELDQLMTAFSLACSDNGLCFVTDTMFKYHNFGDSMYLYKIKNGGRRTLYITRKKNRFTTEAMKKFSDIAKITIGEK